MTLARWKHLLADPDHNPPWCMDWRHVLMINAVLNTALPRRVVEVGTYLGASASAIIEAMEAHPEIETASLIDETDAFDPRLAGALYPHRLHFLRTNFHYVNGLLAECWILDGDHGPGALDDVAKAIAGGAEIIVIHDTHTDLHGIGGHGGSRRAWQSLVARGWANWSDNLLRPDELTHRGIGFAFRTPPAPAVLQGLELLA